MASDAFSTIKKEAISLADFKYAIFSLNDVLMENIWLGNKEETLSENLLFACFNLKIQMRSI